MYKYSQPGSDGESIANSSHNSGRTDNLLPGRICKPDGIGRNKLCMVNGRNHSNDFGIYKRHLYGNSNQCKWMYKYSQPVSDGKSITHSSYNPWRTDIILPGRICKPDGIGRNKLYMVNQLYHGIDFDIHRRHLYGNNN